MLDSCVRQDRGALPSELVAVDRDRALCARRRCVSAQTPVEVRRLSRVRAALSSLPRRWMAELPTLWAHAWPVVDGAPSTGAEVRSVR